MHSKLYSDLFDDGNGHVHLSVSGWNIHCYATQVRALLNAVEAAEMLEDW